jgi:N12 class adenine-specific DNA methylase
MLSSPNLRGCLQTISLPKVVRTGLKARVQTIMDSPGYLRSQEEAELQAVKEVMVMTMKNVKTLRAALAPKPEIDEPTNLADITANEPDLRPGNQDGITQDSAGVAGSLTQDEGDGGVLEGALPPAVDATERSGDNPALRPGDGSQNDESMAGTGGSESPGTNDSGVDRSIRRPDDTGGRRRKRKPSVAPDVRAPAEKAPSRANYQLTNPEAIVGGGPKSKFARNQKAIEVYQDLRTANREPTQEELDTLAGYMGWGSFGQELFQGSWSKSKPKAGWEKEDEWLRDHLGQKEWEGMQTSIINAHYTDPPTVKAVYDIVKALGFTGGRVLEPSMGIGNFFSLMPPDIAANSTLTGIEMDEVSGGMAKILFPQANIQIKPYEQSKTSDNFYDMVIGNWPFSNGIPVDKRYDAIGAVLHDYFFIKALDQTRPGGLVVGITSNGTMDKKGIRSRIEMAKRGKLVAAFRLPTGAFKEYAGTSVVTDILVFQKLEKPSDPRESGFLNLKSVRTPSGTDVEINEYFADHPENILGVLNHGHGTTSYRPGMIVNRTDDLPERLAKVAEMLPKDAAYVPSLTAGQADSYVTNNSNDRQGSVVRTDDGLYVVDGDHLKPLSNVVKYAVKDAAKTAKREAQIKDLVEIRRTVGALLDAQRNNRDSTGLRKQLNDQYDAFTKAHKSIRRSEGISIMARVGDPFMPMLMALEKVNGDTVIKADIFTKDVLRGVRSIKNPSIADAYVLARNASLVLDLPSIAVKAKTTVDEVEKELFATNQIYKTPVGTYEPTDIYLAGNVREKYRQALDAKEQGVMDMDRNIDALAAVIPADIPYFQIEAKIGATWVPSKDYVEFVQSLLNTDSGVKIDKMPQGWKVQMDDGLTRKPEATTTWGVADYSFRKLVSAAMNNATVVIKYPRQEDGSQPVNEKATKEANAKVEAIREEFTKWLWQDPERAGRLEKNYNEVYNAIALPNYDGSHLAFEGLAVSKGNGPFNLRQHQQNAVWRGVVTGRSLNAHEVGTGKTLVMAGLVMESRRLGRARKPIILAHNANARQVAAEIQSAYPGGKVLFVDNFNPATRAATLAQIALDEWDAVVIPHSLISRLSLRPESVEALVREEIEQLEQAAIAAAEDDNASLSIEDMDDPDALKKLRSPTAKELVKEREKVKAMIEKARQMAENPDSVFFEDLGVDMVIVDEAHIFKKLPLSTKQKLKGLNKNGSKRGIMLGLLADYVKRNNGGNGIHLFTGTPITNTLNEVFNMMRYIMDDVMKRDGIAGWDDWFNSFASSTTEVELNSASEWEPVERLSSFVNLPELRRMIGQYLDIVFADDMPEFEPRSDRDERTEDAIGRPFKQVVNEISPMSAVQKAHKEQLSARYRRWKNMNGKQKRDAMRSGAPEMPIMIEGEGVKSSMDYRLIEPNALDTPDSKVYRAAKNIMRHYGEHPKSTQMVFMQTGFSDFVERGNKEKGKVKVPVFNVAKDLKNKLIEAGLSEDEIVIFSDLSADERKIAAEKMQEGLIRVAIGSTETMGTGVNAQMEMRAMHHLDAPWMPGDLEQRNGRGWRQGNRWNTVLEYRYITEGSHDGRRWQILLTKDRFIKKFMKADGSLRVIEGDGVDMEEEGGGGFEETFSAAAGDPRILMREKLNKDVNKLLDKQRSHWQAIANAKNRIPSLERDIRYYSGRIPELSIDADTFAKAREQKFSIVLDGKTITDKDTAENTLADAVEQLPIQETFNTAIQWTTIGEYRGFEIRAFRQRSLASTEPVRKIELRGATDHLVRNVAVGSLDYTLRGITAEITALGQLVKERESSILSLQKVAETPFARQTDLEKKQKQLADLVQDLEANPVPAPSWLRNGAPVGTSVYLDGQEYGVAGHRVIDGEFFVLIEKEEGVEPVEYLNLQNETGLPVFSEVQNQMSPEEVKRQLPKGWELIAPGENSTFLPNLYKRNQSWTVLSEGGISGGEGKTAASAYDAFQRWYEAQPLQSQSFEDSLPANDHYASALDRLKSMEPTDVDFNPDFPLDYIHESTQEASELAKAIGVEIQYQGATTGSQYFMIRPAADFNDVGIPDWADDDAFAGGEVKKYRIANHDPSVFREKQFGFNNDDFRLSKPTTLAEVKKASEWLISKFAIAAEKAYGNGWEGMPWTSKTVSPLAKTDGGTKAKTVALAPDGAAGRVIADEANPTQSGAAVNSFSITTTDRLHDAEYMAAVEAGDMETAQRMVDAAAQAAGLELLQPNDSIDPEYLEPVNEIYPGREKHVAAMAREFAKSGKWNGRPILRLGDRALTGSHRIFAARRANEILRRAGRAEIEIPTFELSEDQAQEFDEWIQGDGAGDTNALSYANFDRTAGDDTDKAKTAKVALMAGVVPIEFEALIRAEELSNWGNGFDRFNGQIYASASQIKSADPITRDEQGNVIPLSQRFNPDSNSILQSQSFEDALRAAGVDLTALNDLTGQAEAETSGNRTVGNPDLGLGGGFTAFGDPVIMGVDAYRAATATEETFDQWDAAARAMLADDYEGTVQRLMANGLQGGQLTPELTRAAQMIVERESRNPLTGPRQRRLQALVYAYRQAGTEQARGLASRRDPFKTPEARHREFLAKQIFTPPAKVRKKMEEAKTAAERQKILDEDAKRIRRIEMEFAKMGVTLDDLFSGGIQLSLRKAAIIGQTAATLGAKEAKAAILLQGGEKTFIDIGKEVGLTPQEVRAVKEKMMTKLAEQLRAMRVRAKAAAGLQSSPLGSQPADLVDVDFAAMAAMSDADAEAEIQKLIRQMGYFPDKQQGKRKTVKRKRLFQPPAAGTGMSLDEYAALPRLPRQDGTQPRIPGTTPPADNSIPPGPGKTWERNIPQQELGLGLNEPVEMEISVLNGADMANVEDMVRLARLAQTVEGHPLDMVQEYWINNLLSGPQTQVVNISGNAAASAWELTVQRGMEAVWNLAIRDKKGAQFGEFRYMAKAIFPGVARGYRLMSKAWRTETDWFDYDVMNNEPELFETGPKGEGRRVAIPDSLGRIGTPGAKSLPGAVIDLAKGKGWKGASVGSTVRIPGRALMAVDGFFKGAVAQLEAAAQAYRIAKAEGLSGEPMQKRMNALLYTPGSQAWQLAVEKARELTFQTELPESLKPLQQWKNSSRLLGFILPFIRTPYNIFRAGIRKSPLGMAHLLYQLGKSGLVKISGGRVGLTPATSPQMMQWLAEQTIAMAALALLKGAAEGDDDDEEKTFLITGSPPADFAERDLQERVAGGSYIIRIGDTKIPYGRIEPIATVLGSIIDALRIWKGGGDSAEKAGLVFGSLKDAALNKTFLSGLAAVFDSVKQPGKLADKGERFILNALVPNLIRQPVRNMDPLVRDSTTADWWYQLAPLGSGAEARVNTATGEDKQKSGNAISRLVIPATIESGKPTLSDIVLRKWNQANPGKPAWAPSSPERTQNLTIGGKPARVKLNAQAYKYLSVRSATLAKNALAGIPLKPTEDDVKRIKDAYEEGRRRAWGELKNRPVDQLGEVEK